MLNYTVERLEDAETGEQFNMLKVNAGPIETDIVELFALVRERDPDGFELLVQHAQHMIDRVAPIEGMEA